MEDSEKIEQNSDELINRSDNSAVENAEEFSMSDEENIEDAVVVEVVEEIEEVEEVDEQIITEKQSAAPDTQKEQLQLEAPAQVPEAEITNTIREIIAEATKSDEEQNKKSGGKPASVLEELDKLKAESQKKEDSEKITKETVDANAEPNGSENSASKSEASVENVSNADEANEEAKESANSSSPSETVATETSDTANTKEENKSHINWSFWKSFIFDVIFLFVCGFFIFALVQKWIASHQTRIEGTRQNVVSIESGEKNTVGNINVLVMGIDSVEGTHRSDTIFVLGVNPSKGKITMLSIPRDTRVIIENKARKINEILPRYGEATLRGIIEDLLKIKISKKAEVGFESFISVIDAIGGVDINIEKAMNYDDNWGNLHIHFNPGMNHLNGKQSLNYVRFRKDAMADLGRIKRQQDFVKAVIRKLISPTVIVRLPSIIEKVFQYINTDFTLSELLTICNSFDSFDIKLKSLSLPGEARYVDKISFFMPYQEEAVAIGDSYFTDMAIFELEKNFESGKIIPKDTSNRKRK